MLPILDYFRKEAKALGRNNNSIEELRMWAVAKFADGFNLGITVTVIFDASGGQVIGLVKTDNKEQAFDVLSKYLEPEDPIEALEWLQQNAKSDAFTVLEPKYAKV